MRIRPLDFPMPEPGGLARGRARAQVGDGATFVDLNDPALAEFVRGGFGSASGAIVSESHLMKVGVAWRCTHIIAGAVGNPKLEVYRRISERERQPALDRPIRNVLTRRPNGWQTPSEFRKMLTAHAVNRGEGYGVKITSRGRILEIWPVRPTRMEAVQNADMSLSYAYTRNDGSKVPLAQGEVFHLRGLTLDGVHGVGVLQHAREALGLSITAELAAGRLFRNGVLSERALKSPNQLSDLAYGRLLKSIEEEKAGAENAGKMLILEEGLDFAEAGLSAEDMQFLAARDFERTDVGMFYGVPPHLYGATDKSTSWGTGIEQQSIGFDTYTVSDWRTMWTDTIRRDLFDPVAEADLEAIIDTRSQLRGDMAGRSAYYARALGAGGSEGWMSANEVRFEEELNPKTGDETGADALPKANVAGKPNESLSVDPDKPGAAGNA